MGNDYYNLKLNGDWLTPIDKSGLPGKVLEKLILQHNHPFTHKEGKKRYGILSKNGKTLFCITENSDFLNSNNKFKSHIQFLIQLDIDKFIQQAQDKATKNTQRIIHNVETANGLIQQELDLILPELRRLDGKKQIRAISETISNNTFNVSRALLKIYKNAAITMMEMSSFHKIYNTEKNNLEKEQHRIHRLLIQVYKSFSQDFLDKEIYVNISDSREKIYTDYEVFYSCLWHVFDNAVKYCQNKSHFEISFHKHYNKDFDITFSMNSLYVDEVERENIFIEGYSGIKATSQMLNGHGIGLSTIRKIAKLLNFSFDFVFGEKMEDSDYTNNQIKIRFKKATTEQKYYENMVGPLRAKTI